MAFSAMQTLVLLRKLSKSTFQPMKVCSKWSCLEVSWVDFECFYAILWRSRWFWTIFSVTFDFFFCHFYCHFDPSWAIWSHFWLFWGLFWDQNRDSQRWPKGHSGTSRAFPHPKGSPGTLCEPRQKYAMHMRKMVNCRKNVKKANYFFMQWTRDRCWFAFGPDKKFRFGILPQFSGICLQPDYFLCR